MEDDLTPEDVTFTLEQEEKLRRCYKEDWFDELNELVNICNLDAPEEDIFYCMKYYIIKLVKHEGMTIDQRVDLFINTLESYSKKESVPFEKTVDGRVTNLAKCGFYEGNGFYIKDKKVSLYGTGKPGIYYRGIYITTDRKMHIVKISMDIKGALSGFEGKKELVYNPALAQNIFEYFEVPVATYLIARDGKFPDRLVLTENFLEDNQELVHLEDLYSTEREIDTYSSRIEIIEDNLRMRYGKQIDEAEFNKMLNKIKLQYAKQEFMKKMLGPMDNNFGNTALLLTTTGNSMDIPKIDLSPAYDLDLSFNISQKLNPPQTRTNNGKTDIASFVEEFKDIEGFTGFFYSVIFKLQEENLASKLIDNTYQKTELEFLKENKENYELYLERKFEEVREAYKKVYCKEKEVEVDDSKTLLD